MLLKKEKWLSWQSALFQILYSIYQGVGYKGISESNNGSQNGCKLWCIWCIMYSVCYDVCITLYKNAKSDVQDTLSVPMFTTQNTISSEFLHKYL